MAQKQVCKGCLKPNVAAYCPVCRKSLFSSAKMSPYASFVLPDRDQKVVLASYNKGKVLQEIRIEYALQQNGNTLELTTEKGSHILKPPPTGSYERLKQLPANEHLTMQIAAQVYKISVAPNCTIFLKTEEPAYLTRRIDMESEEKINITQLIEHTTGYIYNNTAEDIARLLKIYVPAYKPQAERLYNVAVFNYLFSNSNNLVHSFCLVPTIHGDYILSPAYNLISTVLHDSENLDTALYADDHSSETYRQYGYYTYNNFYTLAERIGLVPKRAERILAVFTSNELLVEHMVSQSFLDQESRFLYLKSYYKKLRQLRVR